MNILKDGLLVFSLQNKLFLDNLINVVKKSCKANSLDEMHQEINISDLNNFRINSFLAINKLENWELSYYNFISKEIDALLGPDLLIQRKLNLSIQFPEDHTSILSIHSDTLSGQSPFEVVVWLPLTEAFDSNAMFYFDVETSNLIRDDMIIYEDKGLEFLRLKYWDKHKILTTKPGEIVLFSSTIFHGNLINKTNKTRVSINCRFKNLYSPESSPNPNERGVGMFYKLLKCSPLTQLAINYSLKSDDFK